MRGRAVHGKYRKRAGTLLHRVRAERALGKPLPRGAQVHHADGSRRDDARLVICQDAAYHKLLHVRMRVRAAGGNPDLDRICYICKVVKPITAFVKCRRRIWHCSACKNTYARQRRAQQKAAA